MVPMTVADVFHLRSDPFRLAGAAAALRSLAADLDATARALRDGNAGLGALLDDLDVPTLCGPGTLTFFPHDDTDLDGIHAALRAAGDLRQAVAEDLGCTCNSP
jgi:hypothetical protein